MIDTKKYQQLLANAFALHYAQKTDEWSRDHTLEQAGLAAINEAVARFGHKVSVFDIGCGNGRIVRQISNSITSYLGIDLNTHSDWSSIIGKVKIANFIQGNILECYEHLTTSFDVILDHGCFHHQHPDDWHSYLSLIRKLARPGGMLSLVVWAESIVEGNVDKYGRFHWYFDQNILREKLNLYGFNLVSLYPSIAKRGSKQWQMIFC